jgi:hypothetical protein
MAQRDDKYLRLTAEYEGSVLNRGTVLSVPMFPGYAWWKCTEHSVALARCSKRLQSRMMENASKSPSNQGRGTICSVVTFTRIGAASSWPPRSDFLLLVYSWWL